MQAKSIFMIGYTAVIIPFVTMCLPVLIEIIFPGGVSLKTMMLRMNPFGNDEIPDWVGMLLSTRLNIYMNGVLPAMFTLFFVVTFRHNVVTKAIVWDVVVGAVVYIAIMAYTVVHLVHGMSEYFVDRVDLEPSEIEAFTDSMVHDMMLPIITDDSRICRDYRGDGGIDRTETQKTSDIAADPMKTDCFNLK